MRLAFARQFNHASRVMKKAAVTVFAIAAGLFVASSLAAPAGRPGDKEDPAKKAKRDEALRKYDRNGNGKLDPDEEAAMRADQAREKSKEKKKK
jgi:hypothetical protein